LPRDPGSPRIEGEPCRTRAQSIVSTGVANAIGGRVLIDYVDPPDPMAKAIARIAAPPETDIALLGTDLLAQATWDAANAGSVRPSLDRLTPICNLTPGYSTTLFVAASSPIQGWSGFAETARKATLSLATPQPESVHLRFLEMALNVSIADAPAATRTDLIAAVVDGRAQAGVVNTLNYIAFVAENPGRTRAILTFGGARNAVLGLPTLRELSRNRRLATTNNAAVLGPASLDLATATALYLAFAKAANQPAVRKAARKLGFPLNVEGPDSVRETIDRDRRVVALSERRSAS
jgi:tripartite-type tricarboxylate transporter receptor subunit TctC